RSTVSWNASGPAWPNTSTICRPGNPCASRQDRENPRTPPPNAAMISNTLGTLPRMDDTDAFFTQTVVGPAQTVLMGRRLGPREAAAQGLQLDLTTGQSTLSQLWQD